MLLKLQNRLTKLSVHSAAFPFISQLLRAVNAQTSVKREACRPGSSKESFLCSSSALTVSVYLLRIWKFSSSLSRWKDHPSGSTGCHILPRGAPLSLRALAFIIVPHSDHTQPCIGFPLHQSTHLKNWNHPETMTLAMHTQGPEFNPRAHLKKKLAWWLMETGENLRLTS